MPRTKTAPRPKVGPVQGATRQANLPDEFRRMLDRQLQKGSKVPIVKNVERVSRLARLARRANPYARAWETGWYLGEEAYDYNERRRLARELDAEVEEILDEEMQEDELEFEYGETTVTTIIPPSWEEIDFSTWTEILPPLVLEPGTVGWAGAEYPTGPFNSTDYSTHSYFTPGVWDENGPDPGPGFDYPPLEIDATNGITDFVAIFSQYPNPFGGSATFATQTVGAYQAHSGSDLTVTDPVVSSVTTPVYIPILKDPNDLRWRLRWREQWDEPPVEEEPQTDEDALRDRIKQEPPHIRQPPPKWVKESKVMSRSAKLGIAVFHALDVLSEYSELVDAFYDALPADVRNRWDRDSRGLIDQAGQYGIDGADWKLQALWYNWHRVDGPQALKNIVANEYQDRILGIVHRNTPRNTGGALEQGTKGVNDQVQEFLATLGF